MSAVETAIPARRALLIFLLTLGITGLSLWVARAPVQLPLYVSVAVVLFLATLLNADFGFVLLILSMLFSPEIGLGGAGGRGLEGSRAVTLRTDDCVLLLVGLAWIARMSIHKDLGAIRRTSLNGALALYTVACLFSTLLGIEAGRVRPLVGLLFVSKYLEYVIIFFITVNYVRTESRYRRLLAAVLITAALIVVYATWQIPSGIRPSAPFEGQEGEPNTLGGYLVLIFSVATGVALTVPERAWRRSAALLALGTLPALIATLSRSSWMALVASLSILLIMSPGRRRLAALAIVGMAVLLFAHPQKVEDRLAYTIQGEEHGSLTVGRVRLDPSSSARISSWGGALGAFQRHPIAGWGITGYGFLDAQYFRVLVELGLVGIAAFAFLLSGLARLFLRAFRTLKEPLHRGLGLGLTAGLAGLMVHAIGTNTFLLIRIMEPFWLLTGLSVAAIDLETEA